MVDWLTLRIDLGMLAASLAVIVIFNFVEVYRSRNDRKTTFRSLNARARTAWTYAVMDGGKDILAVQTLRNSTMAATFLATTAIFLITGVLTLSSQGDKLESTWHALNVVGGTGPEVWMMKILVILIDLFAAFLCFTMSVRMFHHVGYMINVPLSTRHGAIDPEVVVAQLNRAGKFYWLGMRSYFFLVPLILWLFGPLFMFAATVVLVGVLYRLDHVPVVAQPIQSAPITPPEPGKLVRMR